MAILYLLYIAFVFILAFYTYFTWTFDYWKRCNVPFEPPTVFVGNMTFALRENMSSYIQRLYKKFDGHDYFGIWLFRKPILVIRSPKIAKEILITKFNYFTDRAMETHESDTIGANSLIVSKGKLWARLRQNLSPVFTKARVRYILATRMPAITKELEEHIDKECVGNPCDLKKLFMQYLVEVISGTIFGIRANSMQDSEAPMLKLGFSFVNWTLYRGMEFMSVFLFPELVKLFKFKLFTEENNNFMRALFLKIIASREAKKPDLKAQSRDFVDALLKLKESGNDFSEDEIVAQAVQFFFAGFETTSAALIFLCYELAFNQEYQEKLYNEIKLLKTKKTEVDFDDLDDLQLLDWCIKETLRKYPVLPYSDRLCGNDCKLSDGLVVKKGIRVLVCTSGLHSDEKYFPEPNRWNPYRFAKEDEMVPFTFMPFSEGKRICIGAKYAMLSMKMTMSSLVERYRFEPCAETVLPKDLRMSPYTILNASDGPIILNIVQR